MTKEITKSIILQELQDKFALREWDLEKFLFSETVIPTYDIGQHVARPTADFAEKSVTSGPTGYVFFIVPDDKVWYLNTYNVIFMAAGAYKVTGLYILHVRNQKSSDSSVYLDMTEGQTVSYAVDLKKPIRLDPGDRLSLLVDDYTSTANLRLYIEFLEVSIR